MAIREIRFYGAVGGGITNDAVAIQASIDACHGSCGGTVLVPARGTFRVGSIELRSHVERHVERGAVLAGSTDPAHCTSRMAGRRTVRRGGRSGERRIHPTTRPSEERNPIEVPARAVPR